MDEKLKILLCEDDENLGMLLREYLQAKGYSAELCPDGEAGYKAFLKSKFDICVLDVMMPKKDGFTLAQEIRQANAEIPIIFLTAKTLKEDILEGFKIGADDKGDALLMDYARTTMEYIDYYLQFDGALYDMVSDELYGKLDILSSLYSMASYLKRNDVLRELNNYYLTLGFTEEELTQPDTVAAAGPAAATAESL